MAFNDRHSNACSGQENHSVNDDLSCERGFREYSVRHPYCPGPTPAWRSKDDNHTATPSCSKPCGQNEDS